MRVTVLGKGPSWPDAGGACSGYLVQEDATAVLLDCGNGVFGKLRAVRDYARVDAVVLSHLHADHFLDLVPFAYALTYGPRAARGERVRPALHAPPGTDACLRRVTGAWGSETLVQDAFALREYDPGETLALGPLTVRFQPVPHFVPAYAVALTAAGSGARFVFGADSGPAPALAAFAREADLLMLEATLPAPEAEGPRGHMTAAEAGEHARAAGARRLVLTHRTDELDPAEAEAEAARAFGGGRPVELAREGAVYEL